MLGSNLERSGNGSFVRSVAMAVATAKQPFHPFREKEKERKREREKERERDNTKTI